MRSAEKSSSIGLHRPRVEHRPMPEVRAVRTAQADRQIALQAHLDRCRVLREALGERVREGHHGLLDGHGARKTLGVVLVRLVPVCAVVPRRHHARCVPSGRVASATNASLAPKASATLRTKPRKNSSPTAPAVPSAIARSKSRPRSRGARSSTATDIDTAILVTPRCRSAPRGRARARPRTRARNTQRGTPSHSSVDDEQRYLHDYRAGKPYAVKRAAKAAATAVILGLAILVIWAVDSELPRHPQRGVRPRGVARHDRRRLLVPARLRTPVQSPPLWLAVAFRRETRPTAPSPAPACRAAQERPFPPVPPRPAPRWAATLGAGNGAQTRASGARTPVIEQRESDASAGARVHSQPERASAGSPRERSGTARACRARGPLGGRWAQTPRARGRLGPWPAVD